MELQLNIIGTILILLALVHGIFPKYLDWDNELRPHRVIYRQIMWVHTLFIALTLIFMGLLCITSAEELIGTPLGRRVSLGLAVFWFIRLLIQFFGYSSELWRGKRFETVVHVLFAILWTYMSAIFFFLYWNGEVR
jgi:hypothetical protein